jgi:transposase
MTEELRIIKKLLTDFDWNLFVIWVAIPELTKVANRFSNNIKVACNAFVESVSNAMAERLNGKIQIIKTIERGY